MDTPIKEMYTVDIEISGRTAGFIELAAFSKEEAERFAEKEIKFKVKKSNNKTNV